MAYGNHGTKNSGKRTMPTINMTFEANENIHMLDFGANLTRFSYKSFPQEERDYGVQTFDNTFGEVYGQDREALARYGMTEFDLIMINGKSATELFGAKYKDAEPEVRAQMMKCEVTKAALSPRNSVDFVRMEDGRFGEPEHVQRECKLEQKFTLWQRFKSFLGYKTPPIQERLAEKDAFEQQQDKENLKLAKEAEYANQFSQEKKAEADKSLDAAKSHNLYFQNVSPVGALLDGFDGRLRLENGEKCFGDPERCTAIVALYAMTTRGLTPEQAFDSEFAGDKAVIGEEFVNKMAAGRAPEIASLFIAMSDKLLEMPVPSMDPSKPLEMAANYKQYQILSKLTDAYNSLVFRTDVEPIRSAMDPEYREKRVQMSNYAVLCKSGVDMVDAVASKAYVDPSKMDAAYMKRALSARQICEYVTDVTHAKGNEPIKMDPKVFIADHLLHRQEQLEEAIEESSRAWLQTPERVQQAIHSGEKPLVYLKHQPGVYFGNSVCVERGDIANSMSRDADQRRSFEEQNAERTTNRTVQQPSREPVGMDSLMESTPKPLQKMEPVKAGKKLEKSGPAK